jgi:hypothetical protein
MWVLLLAGCGGGGGGGGSPGTASVASVVVYPSPVTIGATTTQQFSATARDQAGNAMTGVTFTWSSSNSNIATISSGGVASGLTVGTTNISASAQGVTSTAVALTVVQFTSASGTAARGAAIANAAVTLKDKSGTARAATTNGSGHFSVDTSGLVPPFLVKVQPTAASALYSVSADGNVSGVINITPLTDLIVRSWYGVQGVTVDAAFDNLASNLPPTPSAVAVLSKGMVLIVQKWLVQAGVDGSTFNLISSPFEANGAGMDAVLDRITVDASTRTLTVKDATTIQTSVLSYSTSPAGMTVQTNISNANGSGSTVTSTLVPVQSAEQSIVDGLNATLAALAQAAIAGSGNLNGQDLAPFFGDDFLDGGLPASYVANFMADDLRGYNVSFQLRGIDSLDANAGLATATFGRTLSRANISRTERVQYSFKKVGDHWLLYGDRRQAGRFDFTSQMLTRQGAGENGSGGYVRASMRILPQCAPPDYVCAESGTISGGGIWNMQDLPRDTRRGDFYELHAESALLSTPVPAATSFTFNMNLYSNGATQAVPYVFKTNASTSETISITNLQGTTLAAAQLGEPLTVQWTLPQTYAVENVRLTAVLKSDYQYFNELCDVAGPFLSVTATSGTITLPATCYGKAVLRAAVYVTAEGVNGERSVAVYSFQ